jgi:hypothetical protein
MTVTHRKGRRASRPVMAGHASLHAIGPGLVLLLHAAKSGGGLSSRGGCQTRWHSTIFPSFYHHDQNRRQPAVWTRLEEALLAGLAVLDAQRRGPGQYFLIRTEQVTEIPLRVDSFHLRLLS